jgi:hypothetical protein
MALRKVNAARYVQPLREGGSLPVLVDGDDGGQYVVKLRGAGQGVLALVAEIIAGEVVRTLGLRVPQIALVAIDDDLVKSEHDAEVQALLRRSVGWNVGLEFLTEAAVFDPAAGDVVTAEEASLIVWADAFLLNVDRTGKNANLLVKEKALWPIDHGAALYFHHHWATAWAKTGSKFEAIRDHILLPWAGDGKAASVLAKRRLTEVELARIADLVPDDMLTADVASPVDPAQRRQEYVRFLQERLEKSGAFEEEIHHARQEAI